MYGFKVRRSSPRPFGVTNMFDKSMLLGKNGQDPYHSWEDFRFKGLRTVLSWNIRSKDSPRRSLDNIINKDVVHIKVNRGGLKIQQQQSVK